MHDGVSLLTNFLKFKFDLKFGGLLDIEACSPTFTMFWAIFTPFNPNIGEIAWWSLTFDQFLEIKIWLKLELFQPPLRPILVKPHDGVSLLSSFLELKFDYRFWCPFDRQVCTWTFEMFRNIFTPFKPNLSKTSHWSFTFDQFLRIKIWS